MPFSGGCFLWWSLPFFESCTDFRYTQFSFKFSAEGNMSVLLDLYLEAKFLYVCLYARCKAKKKNLVPVLLVITEDA